MKPVSISHYKRIMLANNFLLDQTISLIKYNQFLSSRYIY